MSTHQEDLDLLLSLEDRVSETPPVSPSQPQTSSLGYLSDDGSPRRRGPADMSVFRNVVEDCLDYQPTPVEKKGKALKNSTVALVEKFSGLRIRNQLMSPAEISECLSEIRFVRLPTIKNLLAGDTLSGCWATVGVLTEKGEPRISSIGQQYCIWEMGCLDETSISLFLFGDAYQQNRKEEVGAVFGLFNCTVRRNTKGTGFSLSVSHARQIMKMGTSADYQICKGKKKDGTACTFIINKRQGMYCRYCKSNKLKASEKYFTKRTELKGGNLRTAFRDPHNSEGIYMVDPLANRTNTKKPMQPVKVLSVEGLRKALSKADKVTPNVHSQGIRFLTQITGKTGSRITNKESVLSSQQMATSDKRKSSDMKQDPFDGIRKTEQLGTKRKKNEQGQASAEQTKQSTGKMIELDYCSSDEELDWM